MIRDRSGENPLGTSNIGCVSRNHHKNPIQRETIEAKASGWRGEQPPPQDKKKKGALEVKKGTKMFIKRGLFRGSAGRTRSRQPRGKIEWGHVQSLRAEQREQKKGKKRGK